jgi:hypothetical protein
MAKEPLKIDPETRPYLRVAFRDTLAEYDLLGLLDLMAEICQENADNAGRGTLGLSTAAWQIRADVLREAAESLERQTTPPTGNGHSHS